MFFIDPIHRRHALLCLCPLYTILLSVILTFSFLISNLPVRIEVNEFSQEFTIIFEDAVYPNLDYPEEAFLLYVTFPLKHSQFFFFTRHDNVLTIPNIYTYIDYGTVEFVNLQQYIYNWNVHHGVVLPPVPVNANQDVNQDEIEVISISSDGSTTISIASTNRFLIIM